MSYDVIFFVSDIQLTIIFPCFGGLCFSSLAIWSMVVDRRWSRCVKWQYRAHLEMKQKPSGNLLHSDMENGHSFSGFTQL